jgi:hypothetical protein
MADRPVSIALGLNMDSWPGAIWYSRFVPVVLPVRQGYGLTFYDCAIQFWSANAASAPVLTSQLQRIQIAAGKQGGFIDLSESKLMAEPIDPAGIGSSGVTDIAFVRSGTYRAFLTRKHPVVDPLLTVGLRFNKASTGYQFRVNVRLWARWTKVTPAESALYVGW